MASATYEESVGIRILDQLTCANGGAGKGRLRAKLGARNITILIAGGFTNEESPLPRSPGIGFRFRGCKKWNGIEIYLDRGAHNYTLRFYQMNWTVLAGPMLTLGEWMKDIYADDLSRVFTDATGLDTHR